MSLTVHTLELDLTDSGLLGERFGESRWRWRCSCSSKGTWRPSWQAANRDGERHIEQTERYWLSVWGAP